MLRPTTQSRVVSFFMYNEVDSGPSKPKTCVHIEQADNGGFVVRAHPSGGEEKTYTYKTLKEALGDLESIFSVAKEEEGEED